MKQDFHFHLSYILIEIINGIKNLFFPFLLAFVIQLRNDSLIWVIGRYGLIVVIILGIIYNILVWKTTTYRFEDERIILKKGVFSKTRITIDYNRIQNIQRITSAVHKFLGVTSLHFSTASSASSSKIVLAAVSNKEANELEQLIHTLKQDTNEEGENLEVDTVEAVEVIRKIHFHATAKQTIKASFTSLSFLVIIPIILFIVDKGSDFFNLEDEFAEWTKRIIGNYMFIAITIGTLLLVGVIAGIVTTYFKYGKFIISSDDERIYIQRGVLSEKSFTILKKNVQGLSINQNLLKRLLRLREIKLIHIGQAVSDDDSTDSLYPFLEEKEANELIKEILPKFYLQPTLLKLPRVALYLRLFSAPFLFIIVLAATFIWKFSYWWAILALMYTIIHRLLTHFFTRYALDGENIVYKTGAFTTEMFITNRNNVIELSFEQGVFQRRFQVCSIEITTRSQPTHVVTLKNVPLEFAEHVLEWYENRTVELEKAQESI